MPSCPTFWAVWHSSSVSRRLWSWYVSQSESDFGLVVSGRAVPVGVAGNPSLVYVTPGKLLEEKRDR